MTGQIRNVNELTAIHRRPEFLPGIPGEGWVELESPTQNGLHQCLSVVLCVQAALGAVPRARDVEPSTFMSRVICGGRLHNEPHIHAHRHQHSVVESLRRHMDRLVIQFSCIYGLAGQMQHQFNSYIQGDLSSVSFSCVQQMVARPSNATLNGDHTQLLPQIRQHYETFLEVAALLNFVQYGYNEWRPYRRFQVLSNLVYDVLCTLNQAMATLGHHEPRQTMLQRAHDMCGIENRYERYLRDREILRVLAGIADTMSWKYDSVPLS